eukprot:CAMPEP_0169278742 /NCGR_PEP_ID=MMETSP1016-20121227/54517_1 /TAXON_ID=342587 /ORGANISM="Karlodinium micrum, Strain CCMP2283" /LENGTH=306 /DNA_ID=CAMNT_0009366583 /DNA_START=464 /DNA_END=1385 /DNA_ORIENTATION=-
MSDTLKAPFSFVVSLPQTLPGQSRALFGQSRALLGQDAVKLPPPCCSMRNTALGGGSTSPAIDCTEGVKLSMLAHEFADPPSPLGVRLLTIATAAGSVLFSTVGLLAVTSLSGLTTSEYVRILSLSTSHWTLYMPFFGQSSGSCTTTPLYHVPWYSTSTRDPTWIALDSALADGVAMSSVGMLLCWLVVCTTTSGIASLTRLAHVRTFVFHASAIPERLEAASGASVKNSSPVYFPRSGESKPKQDISVQLKISSAAGWFSDKTDLLSAPCGCPWQRGSDLAVQQLGGSDQFVLTIGANVAIEEEL